MCPLFLSYTGQKIFSFFFIFPRRPFFFPRFLTTFIRGNESWKRKKKTESAEKIDEVGQEKKKSKETKAQSLIPIFGINLHPTHRTRLWRVRVKFNRRSYFSFNIRNRQFIRRERIISGMFSVFTNTNTSTWLNFKH